MKTASQCLKILSQRKHSAWLQKLSETTYVGDISDLRNRREVSHIPPEFWRGCVRNKGWHYGTYTEVLNALVSDANAQSVVQPGKKQ